MREWACEAHTWILDGPHHRVCLARARLSVRKDTVVESLERVVQEVLSERLVDHFLVRAGSTVRGGM